MNVKVISKLTQDRLNKKIDLSNINVGDTVKVGLKISSKGEERTQYVQGVIIGFSGTGISRNMVIRKIGANNVGVELIIPLHGSALESIELVSKAKRVRRAKLYFLRNANK